MFFKREWMEFHPVSNIIIFLFSLCTDLSPQDMRNCRRTHLLDATYVSRDTHLLNQREMLMRSAVIQIAPTFLARNSLESVRSTAAQLSFIALFFSLGNDLLFLLSPSFLYPETRAVCPFSPIRVPPHSCFPRDAPGN